MSPSENTIGFSTGAISKGDFRTALDLLRPLKLAAVELSALRRSELPTLLAALPDLDLSAFSYISVHAPSRLDPSEEAPVIEELSQILHVCPRIRWIIVHSDVIANPQRWQTLQARLAIENMDTRKSIGRTPEELRPLFDQLPQAKLCLDLAHAEKVDSTMFVARAMIRQFGDRIVQIHLSEITTGSEHRCLSIQGVEAAQRVAKLIPTDVPVILETPANSSESMLRQIRLAQRIFHPALEDLKSDIDSKLQAPYNRQEVARIFLGSLSNAEDARAGIFSLPHGGAIARGQVFVSAQDLYNSLTPAERSEIEDYYALRLRELLDEFPTLAAPVGPAQTR